MPREEFVSARERMSAAAAVAFRAVTIECLEERRLMAVTVPSGFQYSTFLSVPNMPESTSMAFAPDGRLYYTEKAGAVRVVRNGVLQPTPVVRVSTDGFAERGLESIALDPNFSTNGFFYVYYTKRDPANPNVAPNNAKNRVSRFKVDLNNRDRLDTSVPEKVLIDNIASDSGFHNGGWMNFGLDGKLYIGTGEAGKPQANLASPYAQDLNHLSGKILRINPDGSIPSDNPFVGQANRKPQIWAWGVRNPYSGAVNPRTGTLYVNDVGSNLWEEINEVGKGRNFGWPAAEGPSTNPAYTNAVFAYNHNGGQAAITGGTFYDGARATQFPASYKGKYFFTDYVNKFIKVLDPATRQVTGFATGANAILDLEVGPDGAIYGLAPYVHQIVRISFVGSGQNRAPTAVASADKTSGPTPLTVNFSAAGSSDPDGDALTYSWNFGDGQSASGLSVSHTYTTNGTFQARVTVSDGKGASDTSDPITLRPGNRAPTVTITSPAAGLEYDAGERFTFAATASDPEDGALSDAALTWEIRLHHDEHTHPFLSGTGGSGAFTIPLDGEVAPNQFYRITITATDSGGASTVATRDIQPHLGTFTLASNVAGLKLTLDGQTFTAPTTITGVVNAPRRLGAASTQSFNGKTYRFVSWSDGGAIAHDISTPATATTYTATYEQTATVGSVRVRAAADGYVRDGSFATQNFGSAAGLEVKRVSAPGFSRESYLRFDLSQVGAADQITAAEVRVFGRMLDTRLPSVAIGLYPVASTTWSESGLTWNTRPAAGSAPVATKTIAGTAGAWYSYDITNYLRQQKAAGAAGVSFALRATSLGEGWAGFSSDEAASNRPELVVFGGPGTPPPPPPPPPPGGVILRAAADNHVRDGSFATTNFGSSTNMEVKWVGAPGYSRETYLRFDLTGVGPDSGITSAKVRLFGRKLDTVGPSMTEGLYAVSGGNWNESALTWNTRPAAAGSPLATRSIASTAGAWYEFDITNFLKQQKAAGATSVAFAVRAQAIGEGWAGFASDESAATRPELVVAQQG